MTETDDKDADNLLILLQNAASQLAEHVDCVQIIASKDYPSSGIVRLNAGCGSYHARIGVTKEWIIAEDEKVRQSIE